MANQPMDTMPQSLKTSPPIRRSRGRWWLWLGVGLGLLGEALYLVQVFLLKQLVTPWYLPIMATAGALLVLISVRQRLTWARMVGLVLLALFGGFQWYFLLSISRLPEYKGPVQAEKKIPPFTTTLADGKPFTEKDLEKGTPTGLVFYRGHT
jgi:hypothetical protein